METNNQISVLVCNYNSPLKKILLTIESCILQKDIDLEIIYCDDASQNNYKQEIEQYCEKRDFKNIKFSINDKNVGTVKNIYNGLKKVSFNYVKCIGVGDLFYNEYVCYNVIKHMETNDSTITFCNALYFYDDNNDIKSYSIDNPRDLSPYRTGAFKKRMALRNCSIYKDFILGATYFIKKDTFYESLTECVDLVIYCEDLSYILAILKDNKIDHYNSNGIYYEYGSGISTAPSTEFRKKLDSDFMNMIEYMNKNYSLKIIKKAYKLEKLRINGKNLIKMIATYPRLIVNHFVKHNSKREQIETSFDFYNVCKESVECNTK